MLFACIWTSIQILTRLMHYADKESNALGQWPRAIVVSLRCGGTHMMDGVQVTTGMTCLEVTNM